MKVIIFIWVAILLALAIFAPLKVPPIMLPKSAQFNTFGRLPLAKVVDTGDLQEKEGDEYYKKENCIASLSDQCHYGILGKKGWRKRHAIRKCLEEVKVMCVQGFPDCEELQKQGLMWTCNSRRYGGGFGWN